MYYRINAPDAELVNNKKLNKHQLFQHECITWMNDALDAFEGNFVSFHFNTSKYFNVYNFQLKKFILYFKTKDGNLKERYIFHFHYNKDDDKETGNDIEKKVMYKQTKHLFEVVKSLGSFQKWDEDNINLTVQLIYNGIKIRRFLLVLFS